MLSALDRRHTIAPPGFSRWLMPPAALAIHLCIGQVYATSVYKNSLIAHFDTGQTAIGVIFSIAIVMLGLSAAVAGTWVEANGPRKAMFVSACFWAAGLPGGRARHRDDAAVAAVPGVRACSAASAWGSATSPPSPR